MYLNIKIAEKHKMIDDNDTHLFYVQFRFSSEISFKRTVPSWSRPDRFLSLYSLEASIHGL